MHWVGMDMSYSFMNLTVAFRRVCMNAMRLHRHTCVVRRALLLMSSVEFFCRAPVLRDFSLSASGACVALY